MLDATPGQMGQLCSGCVKQSEGTGELTRAGCCAGYHPSPYCSTTLFHFVLGSDICGMKEKMPLHQASGFTQRENEGEVGIFILLTVSLLGHFELAMSPY